MGNILTYWKAQMGLAIHHTSIVLMQNQLTNNAYDENSKPYSIKR